ncbi:MAG: LD-carboxypeptidase [Myxococcales bacterium]|nr:LD-carboxypeptidase [Myxococcales bacterium]
MRPGDRIGVFAPAGPFADEQLRRGVSFWQKRGYRVHGLENLQEPTAYLAAPDAQRAGTFNRLLADREIRALVAARGGYGTLRILDELDLEPLAAEPRIIIGFSDLTILHLELWRRFHLVSFSGPMIAGSQIDRLTADEQEHFWQTLESDVPPPPVAGEATRVVLAGEAEGPLLGGNLTILAHAALAGRLPSLAGAVLLLEDVNEPPYRIDRYLTALRLGGHLSGILGVAGGDFGPAVDPTLLDTILLDRLGDLGVPIIAGLPIGHGEKNRLVPIGARVRLNTSPPEVHFLEGGVC